MEESILLAGVFETDITPRTGVLINGNFLPRYATQIHDPLLVKAVLLKYADTTVAIVILDTCALSSEIADHIRIGISQSSGIPKNHILIAATHAHSTASLSEVFLSPLDTEYTKKVSQSCIDAVCNAQLQMTPAQIAFGSTSVSKHVVCRRYSMKQGYQFFNPNENPAKDKVVTNPFGYEQYIDQRCGQIDPGLSFIGLKSLKGDWIALLANYSLHYVGDFDENIISADYFGFFANAIKQQLKSARLFVAAMTNGTSGNVNIWDFLSPNRYPVEPFGKTITIANDLAKAVLAEIPTLQWHSATPIKVCSETLKLKLRKPKEVQMHEVKNLVRAVDYKKIDKITRDTLRQIYAREQTLLHESPLFCEAAIQAIKIGPITIGALPGEFFGETGLKLKQQFGRFGYFTICMANGSLGYVPPAHEFKNGGYETWRCRSSKLELEAEKLIRTKLASFF